MVADELALRLTRAHVRPGMRVLDPFCGTGRLLFAAATTSNAACVGIDINPLACLITEAKAAQPCVDRLKELLREAASRPVSVSPPLMLRSTKVEWLSDQVASELGDIIAWLNESRLSRDELVVVATCLSSATRDAAWIRKSGWKLHRMNADGRKRHNISAWTRFTKKLDHYIGQSKINKMLGTIKIHNLDSINLSNVMEADEQVDLIVTSPPYGDSRTTVQYGAASGICLDVVSRLNGLEGLFIPGGVIDRQCLGGGKASLETDFRLRTYWAGASDSEPAKRATVFLQDYAEVLKQCHTALKPGGSFIVIVGRRSLGGYRLRLDDFTRDVLTDIGFDIEKCFKRSLQCKSVPRKINRFGRASDRKIQLEGVTTTMSNEIILVLRKVTRIGKMAA